MSQLSACGRITGWETGHMEDKREHKETDSQEPMELDYGTLELTVLNPYFPQQ